MEAVVVISIMIAILSVFTSCLVIRRVKKQISEMTEVLTEVNIGVQGVQTR